MENKKLDLKKTTPRCGTEIQDLDLSQPLDKVVVEALQTALSEHCVLFFRDQRLTPAQQKTLGDQFGKMHLHPAWPTLVEGHPEIMELVTDENSKRIVGEDWHSDVSCEPEPPLGTTLYMIDVPSVGRDTLFANMYAVFEAFSNPIQHFLKGMTALHDGEHAYRDRYESVKDERKAYPAARYPVVCTHPFSGRKALFVNRIFTTSIIELEKPENDALLKMLFAHIEEPHFQCRFRWKPGSVAFWNNRCVQHRALWDYYPNRRHARRVTIEGDAPFYRP